MVNTNQQDGASAQTEETLRTNTPRDVGITRTLIGSRNELEIAVHRLPPRPPTRRTRTEFFPQLVIATHDHHYQQ